MGVAVGIDVAKEFHWVRAIGSERSELLIDRRVDNEPAALAALVEELEALSRAWPSTGPGRGPPAASTRATPATPR